MLLRFGIANFFSIKDYCELSLVAAPAIKDETRHLKPVLGDKIQVLPSVLLYGANASGKTTVVSAIRALRLHVLESASGRRPQEKVGSAEFLLSPNMNQVPTRFDCDFIIDGVRYHYGFEFTDERYEREWLFSYPEGLPRQLYLREADEDIKFGRSLRGPNKLIEKILRKNALFLSTAAQGSHPVLTRIYEFFEENFRFVSSSCDPANIHARLPREGSIDQRIIEFLRLADTGIHDSIIENRSIDDESRAMSQRIAEALSDIFPPEARAALELDEHRELKLGHVAKDIDSLVYLSLASESRGTIRLIELLTDALYIIDHGGVLVVDELDASLHTVLAKEFIRLFNSRSTNTAHQLIATTHDTNLLDVDELRRDQIWFVTKSVWGETTLVPLSDIRTRKGENLERAYLLGRFGALPTPPLAAMDLDEGV